MQAALSWISLYFLIEPAPPSPQSSVLQHTVVGVNSHAVKTSSMLRWMNYSDSLRPSLVPDDRYYPTPNQIYLGSSEEIRKETTIIRPQEPYQRRSIKLHFICLDPGNSCIEE